MPTHPNILQNRIPNLILLNIQFCSLFHATHTHSCSSMHSNSHKPNMYEHASEPKRLCRTNSQHSTNSFVDILLESTGLIVISLMYSPVEWMVCCVAMWRGPNRTASIIICTENLKALLNQCFGAFVWFNE